MHPPTAISARISSPPPLSLSSSSSPPSSPCCSCCARSAAATAALNAGGRAAVYVVMCVLKSRRGRGHHHCTMVDRVSCHAYSHTTAFSLTQGQRPPAAGAGEGPPLGALALVQRQLLRGGLKLPVGLVGSRAVIVSRRSGVGFCFVAPGREGLGGLDIQYMYMYFNLPATAAAPPTAGRSAGPSSAPRTRQAPSARATRGSGGRKRGIGRRCGGGWTGVDGWVLWVGGS